MAVKYLVSRPMKLPGDVTLTVGDEAPDDVETWHNLQALVASGFLYPYSDNHAYLPPHLYKAVRSREQAELDITLSTTPSPRAEWTEPPAVAKAAELNRMEAESREAQQQRAEERAQKQIAARLGQQINPKPITPPEEKVLTDSSKAKAEQAAGEEWDYADLKELARAWNDDHPDDHIALNSSKENMESALAERGQL